jgi:hypothetical protein
VEVAPGENMTIPFFVNILGVITNIRCPVTDSRFYAAIEKTIGSSLGLTDFSKKMEAFPKPTEFRRASQL